MEHSEIKNTHIALAIDLIDATRRGPELVPSQALVGVDGLLPGIRSIPLIRSDDSDGMRRILDDIVVTRLPTSGNFVSFLLDGDHGVAEAVDLDETFRLCRLDL